jgi:uncharacterized protein
LKKVELDIYGIAPSHMKGSYSLILSEVSGERKLPIIVGQFEAQAIAIPLEGINTERPLTHDLFMQFGKSLHFTITEVFIHLLKEGVFYASLICEHLEGKVTIDCRTSDAIAIAVRFDCPIYTTEEILQQAGIVLDEVNMDKPGRDSGEDPTHVGEKSIHNKYSDLSNEELEKLLDEALRNEDYLKAAQIRDEIDKRK